MRLRNQYQLWRHQGLSKLMEVGLCMLVHPRGWLHAASGAGCLLVSRPESSFSWAADTTSPYITIPTPFFFQPCSTHVCMLEERKQLRTHWWWRLFVVCNKNENWSESATSSVSWKGFIEHIVGVCETICNKMFSQVPLWPAVPGTACSNMLGTV